jgi:hypothetical protein
MRELRMHNTTQKCGQVLKRFREEMQEEAGEGPGIEKGQRGKTTDKTDTAFRIVVPYRLEEITLAYAPNLAAIALCSCSGVLRGCVSFLHVLGKDATQETDCESSAARA